jgi:putative CocE/NonD family hydrolase
MTQTVLPVAPAAAPASPPAPAIRIERNVPVAMRDGTVLRADVYRPRAPGRYPVLVERTPYDVVLRLQEHGEYFATRGYAFVAQNVRGRFASEGEYRFLDDDGWGANRDGYDTVEWAAAQPWSTGEVGVLGGSYSGYTQYALAPTRPPHLRAMYVRQGPLAPYGLFARGGAHQLRLLREWILRALLLAQLQHPSAPPGSEAVRARLEQALEEVESWCRHLPLASFPPAEGLADWYLAQLAHPEDGPHWWDRDAALKLSDVAVPAVHLGGWFDPFLDATIRAFQGIRAPGQRLLIGPWIHWAPGVDKRRVGELDFGPDADVDLNALRGRWFDHWLKGAANGAADGPPVRIFLMGANRWLDYEAWPPAGVVATALYLREGGGRDAASLNNGRLTLAAPDAAERPHSFVYDPAEPVPSLLTYPQQGPRDHRPVEGRLLTYTTDPLERDLTVVGPVGAVLYGLSTAPDTDWVVRLCDVWPDGRSLSVCDGILRARYRDSLERAELLRPGQVYRFEVDLWATAQVFAAGHRLRVQVTSSDFPRYDRNLNTGGPFGAEVRGRAAVNTVFHDAGRASHVVLPVVP